MNFLKKILLFRWPKGGWGLTLYFLVLALIIANVSSFTRIDGFREFFIAFSFIAIWRYGWALINLVRSVIYRKIVFPRWRRLSDDNTDALMPSKIYLLITSFRIDTETTARVVQAAIREAINCGVPTTIVASIVELSDEFLYKDIFKSFSPPDHIELKVVRIPGTGKRDALAQGFRAISRDCPPQDSVMAVVDGDTILLRGVLRRCAPMFKMHPKLGALTTDEVCEVKGASTKSIKLWHSLRYAQRQLLMSSISLSKRVMTLTGRMSMYRTDIVTNSDFISHTTNDHLDHWRLGRFKFLTGDDKSTLYWVLKHGYEQIYIPDTQILTIEPAPTANFVKTSTELMRRWYGNMLRTNARVLKLGPVKIPLFTWWAFLDQKLSMWTSLSGPIFAIMLSFKYDVSILGLYFIWVALVRGVMCILLLSVRYETSWSYPFLLYYSQIYGALVKTYIFFRLDRQRWTRQKTKLDHNISIWESRWRVYSSIVVHIVSVLLFVGFLGIISGYFEIPSEVLNIIGL